MVDRVHWCSVQFFPLQVFQLSFLILLGMFLESGKSFELLLKMAATSIFLLKMSFFMQLIVMSGRLNQLVIDLFDKY